jgi:hypothetical protein
MASGPLNLLSCRPPTQAASSIRALASIARTSFLAKATTVTRDSLAPVSTPTAFLRLFAYVNGIRVLPRLFQDNGELFNVGVPRQARRKEAPHRYGH